MLTEIILETMSGLNDMRATVWCSNSAGLNPADITIIKIKFVIL